MVQSEHLSTPAPPEAVQSDSRVSRFVEWFVSSPLAGLTPWIVFALISGPSRLELAALLALVAAVGVFAIGRFRRTSIKLLELSDLTFFAGLAIVVALASPELHRWLELWSGEIANIALVVIAVGSILIRQPFTLQYAKDEAPEEVWETPLFLHINYVLTWTWAAAFFVGAVSGWYGDAVLANSNNLWTGWVIQTGALVVAAEVTGWYPDLATGRAQIAAGEEPDEPIPTLRELAAPLTVWISIVGILILTLGGGPTWLGIGLIIVGGAAQRAASRATDSDAVATTATA